jgi:uncharacterized protein
MTPASTAGVMRCVDTFPAISKRKAADMAPYLVDIAPISKDHGAVMQVAGELEMDEIVLGTERYPLLGPATFDVTIADTGTAYVAGGTAHATVAAQCARCTRDFGLEVTGDVDAYFTTRAHADEVPEEQDSALVVDGRIDLEPFIVTAVAVAIPLAPLHDPDCKGICPECGADLNEGPCECPTEGADTPLSSLGGLLEAMKADDAGKEPDAG